MKCCVESSSSVLVNGSPTKEFLVEKGFRQGPLVPFLFLMVAERLSGLVREAERKRLFEGAQVRSGNLKVSILQFVDDALFFGDPSMSNILTLKSILRCFEIFNSMIGGVCLEKEKLDRLPMVLNCRRMEVPFTYLGLPVGAN